MQKQNKTWGAGLVACQTSQLQDLLLHVLPRMASASANPPAAEAERTPNHQHTSTHQHCSESIQEGGCDPRVSTPLGLTSQASKQWLMGVITPFLEVQLTATCQASADPTGLTWHPPQQCTSSSATPRKGPRSACASSPYAGSFVTTVRLLSVCTGA